MGILTDANKKANKFLGLDYLTLAMMKNDFMPFIAFFLLYIVHMIFICAIVFSIVNMNSVIQVLGSVLLWFIITFIYRKLANKILQKE